MYFPIFTRFLSFAFYLSIPMACSIYNNYQPQSVTLIHPMTQTIQNLTLKKNEKNLMTRGPTNQRHKTWISTNRLIICYKYFLALAKRRENQLGVYEQLGRYCISCLVNWGLDGSIVSASKFCQPQPQSYAICLQDLSRDSLWGDVNSIKLSNHRLPKGNVFIFEKDLSQERMTPRLTLHRETKIYEPRSNICLR